MSQYFFFPFPSFIPTTQTLNSQYVGKDERLHDPSWYNVLKTSWKKNFLWYVKYLMLSKYFLPSPCLPFILYADIHTSHLRILHSSWIKLFVVTWEIFPTYLYIFVVCRTIYLCIVSVKGFRSKKNW